METTANMPVASRPPRACSTCKHKKLRDKVQLLVAAIVAMLPWLSLDTGCSDAVECPRGRPWALAATMPLNTLKFSSEALVSLCVNVVATATASDSTSDKHKRQRQRWVVAAAPAVVAAQSRRCRRRCRRPERAPKSCPSTHDSGYRRPSSSKRSPTYARAVHSSRRCGPRFP